MHRTDPADIVAMLRSFTLPDEPVVMVHSSLLKFGLVAGGAAAIYRCLEEALGPNATIVMPAFSFSFTKTQLWQARHTKSRMGALTEFFRTKRAKGRTIHPFHSVSVAGKHADAFLACENTASFGPGSPFALLYELDAFNLALGAEFIGGTTYLHHVEEVVQAPYRFYKHFPGVVEDANEERVDRDFKMYVRVIAEDYEYHNDWDLIFGDLVADGCFESKNLGPSKTTLSSIRATHDLYHQRLMANPYYGARVVHHEK